MRRLFDISRLWRLVISLKRPGPVEDIWLLDRFKTIRLDSPWKDLLERQVSQSVWSKLLDRSITTRRWRGWNNLPDNTDNSLLSILNCCSSGTLSNNVDGRATILLPEISEIISKYESPLYKTRSITFEATLKLIIPLIALFLIPIKLLLTIL